MNKEKIPDFLIEKFKTQYDEDDFNKIIKGLNLKNKSTFRVNKLKANNKEILEYLEINKIKYEQIEFFNDAFIIDEEFENIIRKLDIYNDGKIYFQSLSSMLPVLILAPKKNENILDMCAAPRRKNYANC